MNAEVKPTVVLIYGDPGQGKSHLAGKLREEFGYRRITVDDVYVRFIRDRYPDLYFPRLRQFISNHWHAITIDGRLDDLGTAWRNHLYDVIENELRSFPRIVVEGYLVGFALNELKAKLEKRVAVRIIKAENQKYPMDDKEVTVAEIADN
jgi:2-phosphoglycerate kinase